MNTNWPVCSIDECASTEPYSTQIGPFGKALTSHEYTSTGVPVLRGINVNHGRFHDDDFVFISEEKADSLAKFESYSGDVLLVHKGTLGQIGLMPNSRKHQRYIMGNSMLRVRCDRSKLLPEYLYYWLCSAEGQHYIFSRVSQVGVPQIQRPLTTLREAKLPVPPLSEQESITHILGALDDKIELNRWMNETLEGMARAIFKSWFVDFDPVRAKADGRHPPGLDPATAALFPDSFEDSPLGEIPTGWRIEPLKNLASHIGSGATPRGGSKVYVDSGVALIRSQNVYDFEFSWNGLARITPDAADGLAGVAIEPEDILFNITGASILRTCIVNPQVLPARVNQHVARIRARAGVPARFLHLHLASNDTKQRLIGFNTGATREAVTKGHLEAITFAIPDSSKILDTFQNEVEPIYRLKDTNLQQSGTLAEMRDTLLPRLLSGQLRVTRAEQTLEARA